MTDKELRKLAKYIVEELTMPNEDGVDQIGYHLTFFTDDQMEEYENLLIKNQIEQLQRLLDATIISDEDGIDQIGYHLTFFTDDQMEEYENLLIKNQIEQLQRLLDATIISEDYEAAAVILKKIKDIEKQIKDN